MFYLLHIRLLEQINDEIWTSFRSKKEDNKIKTVRPHHRRLSTLM